MFRESDWLKKDIDFNADKRKNAVKMKIISVRLINNSKDYVRCVRKPNFISPKVFSKNFVGIHQVKPVLILDKTIYVGFSVLDLSKLLMYENHYEYIQYKFNARLLFTDIV